MSIQATKLSVIVASLALTLVCATELRAQISHSAGRAVSAVGGVGGAGTYRRAAVGGEQRAVLGDRESFSESGHGRSVGVERPGRDVDGGVVIRRQHESSAFERDRYAEKLCVAACDRYPRIVRHQQRDERPDLEDSRGRESAVGSQNAVLKGRDGSLRRG